jgi:ribonuclease HII
MRAAAVEHPHYGWSTNMGYGAPQHLRALAEHGPTALHRRSFAPVAKYFCEASPEGHTPIS